MNQATEVLLVNMPFAHLLSPSLGLSLLKAALTRDGIPSKVFYFNLKFARLIGEQPYSKIYGGTYTEHLAGEWVFSHSLFQHQTAASVESYFAEVLHDPGDDSPGGPAPRAQALETLKTSLVAAANSVEAFLEECLEDVAACAPRIVGFTSLFHQHVASLSLAKRIKARLPETFVVMGGPNCEGVMGRETLRQFEFVDAVVSGEGDAVFPELARLVLDGKPVSHLQGVYTRGGLAPRVLGQPPQNTFTVESLDALPIPDYDEYFEQLGAYAVELPRRPNLLFESSRGCWWGEKHHCTFCGLNGATMAFRSKSAERALGELAYLTERHPGCPVNVVDNILDMAYFKDFIPLLAERRQKFNLFYEVKANLRKDQLRLLGEAGIRSIQPGVESFSDNVLRVMRKGVSALQNIQLIKWCKELGLDVYYHIIWGFPGETPEDYLEMAGLVPLVTHLPPPLAAAALRVDRFSPNYDQAAQLGFTDLAPYPAYRHVYPFGDEVLSNLAYFFTAEYSTPRNVGDYVRPLADELARWKECGGRSELFWMEKGERLLIWDFRPVAAEPLTVLTGLEKFAYLACDQIMTPRQVAELWRGQSEEPLDREEVREALAPLVARGLMLRRDDSYLSLAYRRNGDAAPGGRAA